MIADFREYFLPTISITIIAGYQLAGFFLYKYFKIRGERLEFNNILLGYGILFSCLISALLLRIISDFFLKDIYGIEIPSKFFYLTILAGCIGYLFIVLRTSIMDYITPYITEVLIILNIFSVVSLFFYEFGSILFNISMLPLVGSLLYIIGIHFKLVHLASGAIKKRLLSIGIGLIMFFIALFLLREGEVLIFYGENEHFFLTLSSPIANFGLTLMFLGMYNFPAFLEFEWKNDLIKLYIIRKEALSELFSFDFTEYIDSSKYQELTLKDDENRQKVLSKAIIGINSIFSTITGTNSSKTKKIKQADLMILLKYSNFGDYGLIFALIVNKETASIDYFLKQIREEFHDQFKNILSDPEKIKGIESDLFSSFKNRVINLLK